MFAVEELSAAYGPVKALNGVTFTAARGQVTAVLGANGAGKTTLLRTVSGLVKSTKGTVKLDGKDITRTATEKLTSYGLSHVPEGRGVIAELTVVENLR